MMDFSAEPKSLKFKIDFFILPHHGLKITGMLKSFDENEGIQNNTPKNRSFPVVFDIPLIKRPTFWLMVEATEILLQTNISKFRELGIGLYINDFFGLKLFRTLSAYCWNAPKIGRKLNSGDPPGADIQSSSAKRSTKLKLEHITCAYIRTLCVDFQENRSIPISKSAPVS